ncbi:MAG: phosphoribosylaminoimidazolesuccinocarboxamide synthase [Actinobacteria bacterium]|nr:phosphoribosylaminoimidazolesuccinocarboxamide synthase [Actinomycetota bacterium]
MSADLEKYLIGRGKVREIYVASDRISAFDVIMPNPIPDKGRVLTGMTLFWLDRTRGIVPNHLRGAWPGELPDEAGAPELRGRAMLCEKLTMLPIECVVRGYLAGSGWKDYGASGGEVSGHRLPDGMDEAQQLPTPIFTPATKAEMGDHDENITVDQARNLIGAEEFAAVEAASIALYEHAAAHARERGIILADTKFEFGYDADGRLVLGDEVMTPDSSRWWPVDGYRTGISPPSYDKQYVRDYLETLDWDKTAPGPELPDDVVRGTANRYREAYEALTDSSFDDYLDKMEVER